LASARANGARETLFDPAGKDATARAGVAQVEVTRVRSSVKATAVTAKSKRMTQGGVQAPSIGVVPKSSARRGAKDSEDALRQVLDSAKASDAGSATLDATICLYVWL
jgi:hypothetical protein